MIRSVLVLAVLANFTVAAPIVAADTVDTRTVVDVSPNLSALVDRAAAVAPVEEHSAPPTVEESHSTPASPAKPEPPAAPASGSSSSNSGKLLPGLGAAGGLVGAAGGLLGSVSGVGTLINSITHDSPSGSANPSCSFLHKLVNDCPAPAATPTPTAATSPSTSPTAAAHRFKA